MPAEVWGHRGWPSRYPDNVLEGIAAAGCVAARVEIDVRRSSDGVLVLSHDPDLAGRPVHATSWAELSGMDLGGRHHPATLDQALGLDPPVPLNIEIKNSPIDPGFEKDLSIADLVAERARGGDVISSFHWPTVNRVRELRPDLATGLLFEASVPTQDAVAHAVERGHGSIVPHWPLIDGELMEMAQGAGLTVVTWTVNDPDVALRLDAMGVAAIITNDPGAMSRLVGTE